MHQSAAPNSSRKLCAELWWGEVNCDLKSCPLRRQRKTFDCINMKDLNITSFCNKYSPFSSHNYTYLHFSATPWPRLKVIKDKESIYKFWHIYLQFYIQQRWRGGERSISSTWMCVCVFPLQEGTNQTRILMTHSSITVLMINIITAHIIQKEHFTSICMQVTIPVCCPAWVQYTTAVASSKV